MRKKIFSIVLFGAMCVGFVACDEEEPKVNNNGNGTEKTDPNGNGSGSGGGGTTNPTTTTYTVTLSVNDEAMGTVTGAGEYEEGAEATLEATANEGYAFYAWSDGAINNPRILTVTSDTTLVAIFYGFHNGHYYVDLGLPSGTLWATCNVGATAPEEYGDYFAWGEIEPKSYYDWSSTGDYKWGVINWDDRQNYGMTKYNKTDGKTVLDLEDDAAAVNWGGDWRMPTLEEMEDLLNTNNCTWEWTTQNGVYGRKVTSVSNGNSIFLPAVGFRGNSSLNHDGTYGSCWSSSLVAGNEAYLLYFRSDDYGWGSSNRFGGRSVRAVCSK